MLLLLYSKFRKFLSTNPVAGGLMIIVATSMMLAALDLWRMAGQTPKN